MRPAAFFIALALHAATAPTGFPFTGESLTYAIKWPSGISLGEAKLSAAHTGAIWNFELALEASVPGYAVKDDYRARAGDGLCSQEFDRDVVHGSKKASEKITVDGTTATRKTVGGGKTEIQAGDCAHDALTALFYARRELGQGRMPVAQTVLYGAGYQLTFEYSGMQNVTLSDGPAETDRVLCTVAVPNRTGYKLEIFFARDAARTPLLLRVPFALGAISMELVR